MMRRLSLVAGLLLGSAYVGTAYNECPATSSVAYPSVSRVLKGEEGYSVEHASLFTLEYKDNYKVVTNLYTKRQYILYPCGNAIPDVSATSLPSGYKRRYFKTPLKILAAADTTVNPFLQALKQGGSEMGVADRLVSVSKYSVDPCIQKAVACTSNKVASTLASTTPGYSGTTSTFHSVLNVTDAYFDYSESGSVYYNPSRVVTFSASADKTLLGRAEWLKYVAAFFNLEIEAEIAFRAIKADAALTSLRARLSDGRPLVAFVSYDCDWGGYTTSCTGTETYSISTAPYKVTAIEAAGGRMRYMDDSKYSGLSTSPYGRSTYQLKHAYNGSDPDNGKDRKSNRDAFKALIADADIIIDETYYSTFTDATSSAVLTSLNFTSSDTSYAFVKNQKIYRQDKTVSASGSDWWERGIYRADLLLKDLARAMHPENSKLSSNSPTFLRNVFTESIKTLTTSDCSGKYPICDTSVSSYPLQPICDRSSFKKCGDKSAVFLRADKGCKTYTSCSANLSAGDKAAIGVLVPVGFLSLLALAFYCCYKKRAAGQKGVGSPAGPDAASSPPAKSSMI